MRTLWPQQEGRAWALGYRRITRNAYSVFTTLEDPNVRRRAFEAGASAFVHKLALDDDLLSAIKRL